MSKRIIIIVVSLLLNQKMEAQSFLVLSNDDFGGKSSIYLDDKAYPFTRKDTELLRVHYNCFLALEDSITTGPDVTMVTGGIATTVPVDKRIIDRRHIEGLFVLQVGDQMSKFQSLCRFKSDSVFRSGGSHFMAGAYFSEKANPIFSQDCYYKDLKTSRLTFTGRLAADDFMYEDNLPAIRWEIKNEKKEICGWDCRLAIGDFRGRTYYAWFAERLPSSAGPWKICGLPGVILSVEDSEAKLKIEATVVKNGNGEILSTDYPYIKVSRAQYMKLLEQNQRDPGLFAYNHTSRSGWITILKEDRKVHPFPRFTIMERE